jgi:ubiquinone/menaquinone biosynthesis C-methylase UbiE
MGLYKVVYSITSKLRIMKRVKERVPEGGAIEDDGGMTAEEYGAIMAERLQSEYRRFVSDLLLERTIPRGARALEIGPGPGWVGIELAKKRRDISVLAVDASEDMTRAAGKNASAEGVSDRIEYRKGVAETLEDVPGASCDLVFSRDSLHHWEDPVRAFRSILRVLKPSGSVFVRDCRRARWPGTGSHRSRPATRRKRFPR